MFLELYSKYIKDFGPPNDSGFHSVKCPLHLDTKPSAAVNSKSGVFHCFVCGSFSVIRFIAEIEKVSNAEATIILDKFQKSYIDKYGADAVDLDNSFSIRRIVYKPEWDALYSKSKNLIKESLPIVQNYLESRRLTYKTLIDNGVGFLPASDTEWKKDSLVFPYTYKKRVVALRYRDIKGNKLSKPGSKFLPFGIDQISEGCNSVYIVEGESDYLTMRQNTDECVVATPGALFKPDWARYFVGINNIFVIPHDDLAGSKTPSLIQSCIPSVKIIKLPFARKDEGKDIAEWLLQHTQDELISFLELNKPPKKSILNTEGLLLTAQNDIDWYISDCISPGQIGIIAGSPKSMKTWFAMNLIRCLLEPGSYFLGNELWKNKSEVPLKCLFVEEEGSVSDIANRIRQSLAGMDVDPNLFWAFRMGVRLDTGENLDLIEEFIDYNKINVLLFDPLQRLHSCDENSSSEMSAVWTNIVKLQLRFPKLAIIIIHHFTKSSNIANRWNALRGTSRLAGEFDFGFFLEQLPIENRPFPGIRFYMDGRLMSTNSIENLWTAQFEDGFMTIREIEEE